MQHTMLHMHLLLQAAQAPGGDMTMTFIFFGAMILIFWLFMIRPQAKRQKEQNKFINALEKGDEVATASGMLGRIAKIEDDVITLEVSNKVFVRITRSAISKEITENVYGAKEKEKAEQ
jgi:preprotein translocase subunit YajC